MTTRRPPDKPPRKVAKRARRTVAIKRDVINSQIITGDNNVIYNHPPVATALHQLRAPVGDFVGRSKEVETLINALRRDSCACITGISGMGGIGKTELALLVARGLEDDYPDAQFFLNLQGTDANPKPPQELLAACIRAFLGPEVKLPEDLHALAQLYCSRLNGKRVLLLLDNAADTAQVLPLLPPTGSALLITSRQSIALPGMTLLTLDPLSKNESRRLLLKIARRAKPVADEICKLCGYLPLAIRAAGSLLAITADLDPVDYAAQLQDERNRVERIGTVGVEIGVAASFNLSYARLEPKTGLVFRLLSVFPASFDAAAEELICRDTDHVELSDLVRRNLVLYDESTKRYHLHDLARLFAQVKVTAEEREVAQIRFATYYKEVLAVANRLYLQGGETLLRGLALFDLEWTNIQAGHAWVAVQSDADVASLAIQYPDAGRYVLYLRQHSREQIRWLEIALAAARRLEHRTAELAMLNNLANAYADLGETGAAIKLYEQALLIVRMLGDRGREAAIVGSLGIAYAELGETRSAIPFFEHYLAIATELGDRRGRSNALGSLGHAYGIMGEIHRAIEFFQQALLIDRELEDRRSEGVTLTNLGNARAELRDTAGAMQFYEQALLIVRQLGDRRGEGVALWNMSVLLDRLGKRAQAIQYAGQSLSIFEQIEDPNAAQVRAKLAGWREEQATTDPR